MVIKRVGGKAKIAKWIKSYMPSGSIFVDVFGGSGAVLDIMLGNSKIRYVFNDLDDKIHNFFKVLQCKGHQLSHLTNLTPYGRKIFDESFDVMNDKEYKTLDDVQKAVIFLVVNRQSFSAKMEKPWSITRDGEINYNTWSGLPKYIVKTQQKWKGVFLENLDYREILQKWDSPTAAFYLDPPYEGVENNYYDVNKKDGFDHFEMEHILSNVKGSYCVSYYGATTPEKDPPLLGLYKKQGCDVVRTAVHKHVALGDKKSTAVEVLLVKRNKWSKNMDGDMF